MKILIVDDNDTMRRIIKLVLDSRENQFAECDNGRSAVSVYAEFRPDMVLMDLKMPEMNGFDATKDICTRFPDAKVVIVTDYDDTALLNASINAGAQGYVLKEKLLDVHQFMDKWK